jgi:hypothetical protein
VCKELETICFCWNGIPLLNKSHIIISTATDEDPGLWIESYQTELINQMEKSDQKELGKRNLPGSPANGPFPL